MKGMKLADDCDIYQELLDTLRCFGWDDYNLLTTFGQKDLSISVQLHEALTITVARHISLAAFMAWGETDLYDNNKWVVATDLRHFIAYYQGDPVIEGTFSNYDSSLSIILNRGAVGSGAALQFIQSVIQNPIDPEMTNRCLQFINTLRIDLGREVLKQRSTAKGIDSRNEPVLESIDADVWSIIDDILEKKTLSISSRDCLISIDEILRRHSIKSSELINFIESVFIGPVFARHVGFAYELSIAQHLTIRSHNNDELLFNSLADQYIPDLFQLELIKNTVKRDNGVYYTPNDVVQFMTMESVSSSVDVILNQLDCIDILPVDEARSKLLAALKQLKNITILDPSVGCGEFLVESLKIISKGYLKFIQALKKITENNYVNALPHRQATKALKEISNPYIVTLRYNLYGIDIDPRARRYCVLNLISRSFHASNLCVKNVHELRAVIQQKIVVKDTLSVSATNENQIKSPLLFNQNIATNNYVGDLFPHVFKGKVKGFTIVIGNPPYHKLSSSERQIAAKNGFISTSSGDIYCLFIELVIRLLNKQNGSCCMIVPLSFAFSKKMSKLRELIIEKQQFSMIMSHYDNIPDTIFKAGKPENVNSNQANSQRATIFKISRPVNKKQILSTDLIRWRSSDRSNLFNEIRYADVTGLYDAAIGFPKIGRQQLVDFLLHANKRSLRLGELLDKAGKSNLFIPSTARYFLPAVTHSLARSGEISFSVADETNRLIIAAAINSNIFYWYWRVYGDGFHVTKSLIESFPVPIAWTDNLKSEVIDAIRLLLSSESACTVSKKNASKISVNVNFNKRQDLLETIDNLYLSGLGLSDYESNDFSDYKLTSYVK